MNLINFQISLFGPAHRSAQAGFRPGWRQRRPASEPAHTGARPGQRQRLPASWPAQAGPPSEPAGLLAGSGRRPGRGALERAVTATAGGDGGQRREREGERKEMRCRGSSSGGEAELRGGRVHEATRQGRVRPWPNGDRRCRATARSHRARGRERSGPGRRRAHREAAAAVARAWG